MQDILSIVPLVAIIVFSCLAYGSIAPLPMTIVETLIGIMLICWLLEACKKRSALEKRGFWLPLALFLCTVIVQVLPFSLTTIRALSVSTYRIYEHCMPSAAMPASFTLSIYPDATITELYKAAAYAGLFFFIVNRITTKRQLDYLINTIILFGFCISIFGIIQRYAYSDRVYWFDLPHSAGSPFGPFFNRNNFAGYINMIIPLGLGYFLTDMQLAKRIIYGVAVGVMSLALALSLSRGGIIVYLATFLFIFLALSLKKRFHQKSLFIFIWLIVMVCAFAVYLDIRVVGQRLATVFRKDSWAALGHGYLWLDCVRIWRDFPVFGTGLGTFGAISALYKTSPLQVFFSYAHNDYLQFLSEAGLAGCVCIAWFFGMYCVDVLRAWFRRHDTYVLCLVLGGSASLFAMLAYSLLDFNLHIPANAILFTVILGVVYRLAFLPSERVAVR